MPEDDGGGEPADPEVAPGAVVHEVFVLLVFRRLLHASPVSVVFRRLGFDASLIVMIFLAWARCDIKTCNKWCMLLEPLAKKVKGLKCKKDTKIEAGVASVICA